MSGTINESDRDEETSVDTFQKKLSASGSGEGVSLHFDADFATRYGLTSDLEVDVEVVERDGDVLFEIGNIPAGFSHEKLQAFAEDQNWMQTDRYVDSDEWYLTYRNHSGNVRIELDSVTQINGVLVNNIVVQSDPIETSEDRDRYNRLCAIAQQKDLRVRVDDSQGLWQRLKASEKDTDDAPDGETFQQLISTAETVTVQLVCQRSSVNTSLDDLKEIVDQIEDTYQTVNAS